MISHEMPIRAPPPPAVLLKSAGDQFCQKLRPLPFPGFDVGHRGDQVLASRQIPDAPFAVVRRTSGSDAAALRFPVRTIGREQDHRGIGGPAGRADERTGEGRDAVGNRDLGVGH